MLTAPPSEFPHSWCHCWARLPINPSVQHKKKAVRPNDLRTNPFSIHIHLISVNNKYLHRSSIFILKKNELKVVANVRKHQCPAQVTKSRKAPSSHFLWIFLNVSRDTAHFVLLPFLCTLSVMNMVYFECKFFMLVILFLKGLVYFKILYPHNKNTYLEI